jgi:hypothetical protein
MPSLVAPATKTTAASEAAAKAAGTSLSVTSMSRLIVTATAVPPRNAPAAWKTKEKAQAVR